MKVNYRAKYNEAFYNLNQAQELFLKRDQDLEICLNNFLSSVQSVFWMLNNSFNKKYNYEKWQMHRSSRLHESSKIFKELRNISLKEYPIEVDKYILGFKIGEPGLPAGATFTSPMIDSKTGRPLNNKCTIRTKEGNEYEVDAIAIHDFSVNAISDGKEYFIEAFINTAREYLKSIEKEIVSTESKFK
jgi:hypothetical protein